jgi:WXG100 family type VII secretion target
MTTAHVDPGELRRFARDLNRFKADIQTLVSGLQGRLRTLEQTWRDQQQQKFSQEFEQAMKGFNRFLDLSDQHVSFLNQKAAHIEEYLRQR